MSTKRLFIALFLALCLPSVSLAHATGEDYVVLRFETEAIEGHFEVHVDELREKLGVEVATLEDLKRASARVQEYLATNFLIGPEGGDPYELEFVRLDLMELPQGLYAQFFFRVASGPLPDRLELQHSMFYDDDRLHRGLVLVEYNSKTATTYPDEYTAMVFSPSNREQTLDLTDIPAIMGPREMIPQGVLHIWKGIDHVLFLLALMIPIVVVRTENGLQPVESFAQSAWSLLKIVTVFTIAHSVTLLLAALDFIVLPSRLVESVIALSIILVAWNNITGKMKRGSLWVILILGLFHGLGFASVMGHLPFRMVDLLKVVIGFNIGVELGQIALVCLFFPVLFLLRGWSLYESVVLKGASAVLIAISSWWLIQRAFGLG